MSDREEREEHIKRLEAALACEEKQFSGKCSKAECDDNCALLYEQGNWGEWKDTLRYAIESLKTDLKYDLMYEGALEQEPRKGHWIETAEEYYKAINEKGGGVNEDTDYFTDDIACSECLAKFSVIDNEAERFDFCPCCGSDNK